MQSVVAIFRKDARRLWPQIAIFWTMLGLAVFFDPGRAERIGSQFSILLFLSFAKPLACWTLLIAAIHEERLPGDRQYWLTRPFTWRTLLIEKTLFIACFVNLAVFISHTAILLRAGISPASHIPALLWKQVFFSALIVLPVAAFAAVTRNLGQVILTGFLVLVPFFALQQWRGFVFRQVDWLKLDWLRDSIGATVVVVGVVAILYLQYSSRRTTTSRILIAVTAVCQILLTGFLPRAWALSLRSLAPSTAEFRVEAALLDPSQRMPNQFGGPSNSVTFELPIRLDGIPPGAEFIPERFSARIDLPGGSPIQALPNRIMVTAPGRAQLSLYVGAGVYELIKHRSIDIGGTMEFALMRGVKTLAIPEGAGESVPGVGVCYPSVTHFLTGPPRLNVACSTPFPRLGVYLAGETGRPNWIVPPGSARDPIPTDNGFELLQRYSSQISYQDETEMRGVRLYTGRPITHAQLNYSFHDAKLADYVP